MTTFIQLHLLTAYPPANLNRDDTGRPKTAQFGGVTRLRQSSQALKRAYRTSAPFRELLDGRLGTRTKRLGEMLATRLAAAGTESKSIARRLADQLGKLKADGAEIEQLAHLSPDEVSALEALADRLAAGEEIPDDAIKVLGKGRPAADIAMFGRMLAASPQFNVEAAVQVAHALTTHRVTVEDDYFTAVDDLKSVEEDRGRGAGHVGELGFGAGLFYLYVCIDKDLLIRNLDGDRILANTALEALVRAASMVGPKGKQNSFASRAYAGYVLAEAGRQQPRSLAAAFLKPVSDRADDPDHLARSIERLEEMRDRLDAAYGPNADDRRTMNTCSKSGGTLQGIIDFVTSA
jgi:CRISPR system Cascade subunit CasC